MKAEMRFNRWCLALVASFAGLALASCGGDDGAGVGGGAPGAVQGQFLDSAVDGLNYVAAGDTGQTDTQGHFPYEAGTTVQFSVGGIVIGSGLALPKMTPLDLVLGATSEVDDNVTNIARFVQTIDDDGDPTNGITITEAVRNAAAGRSIDFTQNGAAFGADANVLSVVSDLTAQTQAGTRPLVSAQSAQDHLRGTLIGTYDGVYTGTYALDQQPQQSVGTWRITVASGGVACSFTNSGPVSASSFNLQGTMNLPGILDVAQINGAFIYGTIERDGSVSGRWYGSPQAGDSGEFTGRRQ